MPHIIQSKCVQNVLFQIISAQSSFVSIVTSSLANILPRKNVQSQNNEGIEVDYDEITCALHTASHQDTLKPRMIF